MRRSTWLNICFGGSVIAVAVAMAVKVYNDPGGGPAGDSLVMMSPVFFAMAAKKATRFPKMAIGMGTLGLLFAVGALAAVLAGKAG